MRASIISQPSSTPRRRKRVIIRFALTGVGVPLLLMGFAELVWYLQDAHVISPTGVVDTSIQAAYLLFWVPSFGLMAMSSGGLSYALNVSILVLINAGVYAGIGYAVARFQEGKWLIPLLIAATVGGYWFFVLSLFA